jgi:hypothetical protein
VVIGNGTEPQDEGPDQTHFVIQALQKATGALRWRNQSLLSLATLEPLYASRDQKAFAVGTRRDPATGTSALLVGAYDVPTGAVRWEDVWMPSGPDVIDADH